MEEDQMKRLAILVLISALLTFTAAMALAHDDDNGFKHFSGTYEMSASGSCIHSQNGYYQNPIGWYLPNDGVVYAGTTVSNGTWIFKKNGTGTYSYVMYATVTPPVKPPPVQEPPCLIPGGIRIFSSSHNVNENVVNEYTFTYDITKFGDITIETEEGDTLEGSISIDKKTITLFDALRVKGPGSAVCPWWNIICTATRTLIKVHD
jgi:hypothetical protein